MLTDAQYIQGSSTHRVPDELHELLKFSLSISARGQRKKHAGPANPAPTPPPKPASTPGTVKKRAFLYIVADTLGWGQNTTPALMVIGHTDSKGTITQWGVPGGQQDRDDAGDLMVTAVREFMEEVLIQKNPSQAAVQGIILALQSIATVSVLSATPEMMTVMVRVQSAQMFEAALMTKVFGSASTASQKANVFLSKETKGVTWLTLDAINKAVLSNNHKPTGQTLVYSRALNDILATRPYTIGRFSKQTGRWAPSAAMSMIMKLYKIW